MKIGVCGDIETTYRKIEEEKKLTILKHTFLNRTGCATWEEACEEFEEFTEKIPDYLRK